MQTTALLRRLSLGATALLLALVSAPPPADSEPVGVPVPPTRGGTLVAWGANDDGESTVPPSLTGKTVIAIAAGRSHSLALTSVGTVIAWGTNESGESTVPPSLTGKTVSAVAAGVRNSLALTSDGTITAWGANDHGQSVVPPSLTGKTVTAIATQGRHSLALTSDGTITAWGANPKGQTDIPTSLAGKTVTAIASGGDHSLALTSDGIVTAWGENLSGQTDVPASLTGKTVTAIAAGDNYSLALTTDGVVVAWGDNSNGQTDIPASLSGRAVTAIAAGNAHALVLTSDGQVIAWGEPDPDDSPTVPANLAGRLVMAIAGGNRFSLAIVTDFRATQPPAITGHAIVGSTVTAAPGAYTAQPDSLAYQWYADGAAVAGATSATFVPTVDLTGRRLTVRVTAGLTDRGTVTTTSEPSAPVFVTTAPTVSLNASRTSLRRGQAVTLTWSTATAASVVASGGWSGAQPASGTVTVRPTALGATSYVLGATNAAGTTSTQVQVRVTRPAVRLRVSAPGRHRAGTRATVRVRGLEAHERYTIRVGKRSVRGITKNARPLVRVVALPKAGGRVTIRVIGDQPDRTGSVRVHVRR